jgi:hypothetical protein
VPLPADGQNYKLAPALFVSNQGEPARIAIE